MTWILREKWKNPKISDKKVVALSCEKTMNKTHDNLVIWKPDKTKAMLNGNAFWEN
jgi:hypothetical protein